MWSKELFLMPYDRAKLLDLFFYHSFINLSWLAVFCFCTIFFATWLTFNWIKAEILAEKGGVKWHKVETLLGGIVILHWKLPREEGGWGNWPAILFRKPLSCTSGAFRIHLIYITTIKTWNYETVWKEDWGHCSRKKERLEHRYPSADCRADGPLRRICRLLFGFCLAMTAGGDFYVGGLWMFLSRCSVQSSPKNNSIFFGETDFFGMSRRNFAIPYPIFLSNSN